MGEIQERMVQNHAANLFPVSSRSDGRRACRTISGKPAADNLQAIKEKGGYLDKMGDENLLKGSYWTFRVITSIIWASPDDGSSA